METQQRHLETMDQLTSDVMRSVHTVIEQTTDATAPVDDMSDILTLLNALPMSTSEFGLAINRVKNACQYLRSNTPGAARYELRMLLGSLQGNLASHARTERSQQRSAARRRGRWSSR